MKNSRKCRGQGLIEYILIVGLMGVLAIAAINGLSKQTQSGFRDATNRLENEFSKFGG